MPAGTRLDVALIRLHPDLSRRKARDVIEKGQVSVDGRTVHEPGRTVAESERITWDPNRKAQRRSRISLPVLYQDEHLIVIDKPAGLLTVRTSPEATDEDTALARVQAYVAHLNPRRPYVGMVHRLDRYTSGALAFALTAEARRGLIDLFRDHRIERAYAALVTGTPKEEQGVIDLPIGETYAGGRKRVARSGEDALPAVTRFKVAERFAGAALLDVTLDTGRQHQVRIHLAAIHLPVLGDPVYRPKGTARVPVAVRRQMLHARRLAFVHPLTGRTVQVSSPLPEDFQHALAKLRRTRS